MIQTIFPVNVVIKDYDMPEEFTNEVSSVIQSIFHSLVLEKGLTPDQISDNEFPVFTEESMKEFPVLRQLREMFVDSFYELANSYEDNALTRELISQMVEGNLGKLPLMKKGDYKRLHTHFNSSAFAIFYLSDVDNDKFGGQLILKDPAFHSNSSFHPPQDFEIDTKKNRMIVAPAYVWHEVTPYVGEEDRIAVVMNLEVNTHLLDELTNL